MTQSDARRLKLTTTIAEVHAIADRVLGECRARAQRVAAKPPAPGKTKEQRDALAGAVYAIDRAAAFRRAGASATTPPQCEVYTDGVRCNCEGVDPDHVIGGSSKRDSERLGADGLQVMCRAHHDQKTVNSPTRAYWLTQAKEHAIRIGSRGLLALVERAIARHEAKHPHLTPTEAA